MLQLRGASDGCHDTDGWLGGGQVGFNYQAGQCVFGVEFSGSWADINGSHTALLIPGDTYRSEMNSLLLFTGRVGMTFDRLLIYVTGGGAWARDEFNYTSPGVGTATTKQNRTGWTIGAGLEYGLSPNWSIAAQYNYIDLGDKDVTFGAPSRRVHRSRRSGHPPRHGAAQLPLRRRSDRRSLLSVASARIQRAPGASPGLLFL